MLDWIASSLSTEQQEPFERDTPNDCLLAAAGSGKTRTLSHLVVSDLASGIPATSIVAFTFTEKAAEELLARIHLLAREHLPEVDVAGMYVGTIHGWCLQYLMEQSEFYNVDPIDELELDALVSRLYDPLGLQSSYGQPYPKAIPKFLADLEIFYNEQLEIDDIPTNIRESILRFTDYLKNNRLMTFGGMIRDAVNYLRSHGPVSTLQALYVDEYQDVNPAQVALIKAMLPQEGKVISVGDDLQCIYQWRGSDVARILNFSSEFPPASVHRLETNYRSRPGIVRLGNKIAERVTIRDPEKMMGEGRPETPCAAVHWFSADSEEEQAQAVVQIVHEFAERGVPWNKMAILLRSVVGSGPPIVEALEAHNVPFNCPTLSRGGELITDFLIPLFDWMRLEHPEPRNSSEEAEYASATDAIWAAAQKWVPDYDGAEDDFWDGVNEWLALIEAGHSDAYDVRGRLYDFFDRCRIRIAPDDHDLTVSLGIATQIIRSVEEIHRRRIAGQPRRTARGIMSEIYFALGRNHREFGESLPVTTTTDGVLVTTVHQAKGLEWPIVILPRLDRRCFPISRRPHGTSFPDSVAGRYGTDLDDERRLFYVAATRARERLFLLDSSSAKDEGRSVFLRELREDGVISLIDPTDVDPLVWSLATEDLIDSAAPPLRIGLSDILLYLECPYQYGLRRIADIQPSVKDDLGFGKGLHELIQRRFDAEYAWTAEELEQQVDAHVHIPLMSEKGEKQSKGAIKERIQALEKIGVFDAQVESEVDIEVVLPEGIVHGIIDGVQQNTDGTILVRDWKSSVHEQFLPRYQRQLQFYAYALRLQGKNVSGADLVNVSASTQEGRLITQEVDVSESTVAGLIESIRVAMRGIAEGDFPAHPSEAACGSCDMRRICAERYVP